MCGLMKCCVNCKYYEHIRELDNEVDWCHYPNQEGIISNDPEYVKSERSGDCEHYERLEYKQYIEPTPYNLTPPIQKEAEFKIGDRVYVNKTEGKASYGYILTCKGTIIDITFEPFYNRTTYKVKIDDKINKYQEDGLFIFHKSKSLLNINQCENKTIKVEVNKMNNSVFDNDTIIKSYTNCTEPSIVDQYSNKKRATYEKERDEAIQKINEASPVGKAITNFIAALKKAGLKDELIPCFNMLWNDNCLTDAEKAAIKEVHAAYSAAMTKMLEKRRECVAILVNCETFEQKMTVLQKYDIIDSDYKLKA